MASGSEILQRQLMELRGELKQWEKAYAAANGHKPTRDDIKNDAFVNAKYAKYYTLRKAADVPGDAATPRKRKPEQVRPSSAHKRTALHERTGNGETATPHRAVKHFKSLEAVKEEQEVVPTPSFIRSALGPTPQKDGQVLGIFDVGIAATPSKSAVVTQVAGHEIISGTPSKVRQVPLSSEQAVSRTPQSSSKRRFLESFAGTPLKRKRDDDVGRTSSTSKRQFATPAFLRRSWPLGPTDEESSGIAPPPFKKRGGFVRSLSNIIQGLRKQEEQRMEDEWDVMNELEAEANGEVSKPAAPPKVLVEDSQAAEMPLGPDKGPEDSASDSEDGVEVLGADGKPRKPWKKKGLKRQTKRVIMRPNVQKPKKAAELQLNDNEAVAETQLDGAGKAHHEHLDSDEHDSESEVDEGTSPSKKKVVKNSTDKETASPAKKKVSAQAHANFRRLKIKNKNSKANGKGRKFGRR